MGMFRGLLELVFRGADYPGRFCNDIWPHPSYDVTFISGGKESRLAARVVGVKGFSSLLRHHPVKNGIICPEANTLASILLVRNTARWPDVEG
jgi:hypothetical protein